MMGLQATAGKRKLEGNVGCMDFDVEIGESPSKLGRVEGSWWAMEDGNYNGSSSPSSLSQSPTSYYEMDVTAPCLQSATTCQSSSSPPPPPPTPLHHQHYYQTRNNGGNNGYNSNNNNNNHNHHQQLSRPQQWGGNHYDPPTIRRDENGKSYLELGSSYRANERCCEGSRTSWCRRGRACYRQRRLAVLNISMCKLTRYRQFPDPSLHRSVLICNTLRHLEREMERDRSPPPPMEPVAAPAPIAQLQQPEQGRLTPFPMPPSSSGETDVDSGIGDSDDSRSINWGSVLSLSSQSPLDPLNNNELLDVDIGPDLDLDFMPSWKQLTPLQSTNATTTDEPSSLRSNSSAAHQEQHMQTCGMSSNIASSCSSGSSTNGSAGNNATSTYESLMCVGS